MELPYILFFAFNLVAYLTKNSLIAEAGVQGYVGPQDRSYGRGNIRPIRSKFLGVMIPAAIVGVLLPVAILTAASCYVNKRSAKLKTAAA